MTTDSQRSDALASVTVPPLWPLSTDHYFQFANTKGAIFGWQSKGFHIRRIGGVRAKTVGQFPLTSVGWEKCWETLQGDFPQLAQEVSQRVLLEQGRTQVQRERLAREDESRSLLQSMEMLTSLPNCILLGGHGYSENLRPRTVLDLYLTADDLWASTAGRAAPVIRCAYEETTEVEFSGPGIVTRGGGFIGGGFGAKGALEGMAVAAVLNSITTKSEIRSVIRWEAESLEAFFFTDAATPSDLRIKFSPVLARVRRPTSQAPIEDDSLAKLERLAKLHQEGSLTDEEFSAFKRKMI